MKKQNKNRNFFVPKRLIFFSAEVPRFQEDEVENVRYKSEDGTYLNVKRLVTQVNNVIQDHQDQLEDLPEKYLALMHKEMRDYFLRSPDRFDKNGVVGLSDDRTRDNEFKNYVDAMKLKAAEIMKEYAPNEEEKKAKEKGAKDARESAEKAEQIKPLEINAVEVAKGPGEIKNDQQFRAAYVQYDEWNSGLQREGMNALKLAENFQISYHKFKESISGLYSYRKYGMFMKEHFGSTSVDVDAKFLEMEVGREAQEKAKSKVAAIIEKYQEHKKALEAYGLQLTQVRAGLRRQKEAERDEKIVQLNSRKKETAEEKASRERKKQSIEAERDELQGKRTDLQKYRERLGANAEAGHDEATKTRTKKEQLTGFSQKIKAALGNIDAALKNPDIPEEQKKDLREAQKKLLEKSTQVDTGLQGADQVLAGQAEAAKGLQTEEDKTAQQDTELGQNLDEHFAPVLQSLDVSIHSLDVAQSKYAGTEDDIKIFYKREFDLYDDIDEKVDDAVLKNNLANEKILADLVHSQKVLDNIEIAVPGAYEAVLQLPVALVGGVLSKAGEACTGVADHTYEDLEDWSGPLKNLKGLKFLEYYVLHSLADIGGVGFGALGGTLKFAGGVLQMASNPGDTWDSLRAFISRNPETGEWWDFDTFKKAFINMGKAIISWDNLKKGRLGLVVGEMIPMVAMCFIGGAPLAAGRAAAEAAYLAARVASGGVRNLLGASMRAGWAFGRATVVDTAGSVAKGVRGAKNFVTGGADGVNVATRFARGAKTLVLGSEGEFGGLMEASGKPLNGMKRLARKQQGLLDELSSKAGRYRAFLAELQDLRIKNPGLSDAQLELKLQQKNLQLFNDAAQYEKNMAELQKSRDAMEASLTKDVKSPEIKAKIKNALDARRAAQNAMMETAPDWGNFKKLLDARDPQAIEAYQKFQNAIVTNDLDAMNALKGEYPQWAGAFSFMQDSARNIEAGINMMACRVTDGIQVEFAANPKNIQNHFAKLTREVKTPSQAQVLDRALADFCKGSHEYDVIYQAIHEEAIVADSLLVDQLMKWDINRVAATPKIQLTPAQQVKMVGRLLDGGGDFFHPDAIQRMIVDGRIHPSVRVDYINRLIQTSHGPETAAELILRGEAPMTNKFIGKLLGREGDLDRLGKMLENDRVFFEDGVTKEKVLNDIKLKRQAFGDTDAVQSVSSGKLENPAFKKELRDVLEHLAKGGKMGRGEASYMLQQLKIRDPAAYKMVLQSNIDQLIESGCLEPILKGERITEGAFHYYLGKDAAEYGYRYIGHVRPGEGLEFIRVKDPLGMSAEVPSPRSVLRSDPGANPLGDTTSIPFLGKFEPPPPVAPRVAGEVPTVAPKRGVDVPTKRVAGGDAPTLDGVPTLASKKARGVLPPRAELPIRVVQKAKPPKIRKIAPEDAPTVSDVSRIRKVAGEVTGGEPKTLPRVRASGEAPLSADIFSDGTIELDSVPEDDPIHLDPTSLPKPPKGVDWLPKSKKLPPFDESA